MGRYQPQIIWQGNLVGLLDNPRPDMWYLEGTWFSSHTEAAVAFEAAARQLDTQTVHRDWNNGLEIILEGTAHTIHAIVFSLSGDNSLFVRRITH